MDLAWAIRAGTDRPDNSSESALQAPEFLLQALAGAKVGTWRLEIATNQVTWDATASELMALEPVTRTNPALVSVHVDDHEQVAASLKRSIQCGTPHDIEFRVHRKDGAVRWFHAVANPIKSDGKTPRYVAGVVSDITERKNAELSSQESERRLQSIIDNLPGAAYQCEVGFPWTVSFMSEAAEQITGYSAEDFISGRITAGSLVHPDERANVIATIEAAVCARSQYKVNYRLLHSSNEYKWVQEHGSAVYDDDGNPLFLEGLMGDIHAEKVAARKLEETTERYSLAIRATRDLIWDWDILNNRVNWNDDLAEELGFNRSASDSTTARWNAHMHPDDRDRVLHSIKAVLSGREAQFCTDYRFRRVDGTYAPIFDRGYVIRDTTGRAVRMVGAIQDLSEQLRASAKLSESEMLNRSVLDASADCIKIVALDGTLLFMNGPGRRALELDDSDRLEGKEWATVWPTQMAKTVRYAVKEAHAGHVSRFSGFCPTKKGTPKWWDVVVTPMLNEAGDVVSLLSISRDSTETRRASEKLRWASEHDALTQLPNRRAFEAYLRTSTIRAMKNGTNVGLLLIDLDHFKHVNDTLGHAAGDYLLRTFGKRLGSGMRTDDFVARLGGDEFAVIVRDLRGENDLRQVGESILSRFRQPVRFDGRLISASASIGGALFPRDADCAIEMFKSADTALYALKAAGRGGTKLFRTYMREQVEKAAHELGSARQVISHGSIRPYYQPKVHLASGQTIGLEALLRWKHPTKGIQLPESIAEAFNDYELAAKIGETMHSRIFSDINDWQCGGVDFGRVSINAAPAEFLRDDYAERLLEQLKMNGLSASVIEVEITEQVFLKRENDFVRRALERLSNEGVRVSLDDFGTGYSSLSHLRDYPVDVIKIDRSFIAQIVSEPEIASIVSAVIDLAGSLAIEVVAEGIETEAQVAMLKQKGCTFGQGYLYGHAMKADEVPIHLCSGLID